MTNYNNKPLNLILIAFIILTSCVTQKKVVNQNEQLPSTTTQTKTNKYEFDLAFMQAKTPKTFVDSIGNIHFADSILENRIKSSLQMDTTKFITKAVADTIKRLFLEGTRSDKPFEQIKSIDGLQYFKNLRSLNIRYNSISNLSPIQDLIHLEKFVASNNRIENVTPLANLLMLKEVDLYYNNVEDISPLLNLSNIEDLNLWDNNVTNIQVLGQLSKLKKINLGKNKIRDISPLIQCKALYSIWIPYNPLTNPELLSKFSETLQVLSIAKCNITNIDYLENCLKLKDLLIFDNQISDISCIHRMSNLKTLSASKNRIVNIDVIPVLIRKGAFQERSRFNRGRNIDLRDNLVNFETEKNKQIKAYIEKNTRGLVL